MEDGTSDLDVPGPEARGLKKDVRVGHVNPSGSRGCVTASVIAQSSVNKVLQRCVLSDTDVFEGVH